MRKIFTLITALFALTATGWSQEEGEELDQTFVFTDMDGNVLPNYTAINVSTLNEEGMMVVPVLVKNQSGQKAAVSMYETIDGLPSGSTWQTCAFGNCMYLDQTGYSSKSIMDADYYGGIQTEWIPEKGKYACWTAELQIRVFNIDRKEVFGMVTEQPGSFIIGYGPKLTINFAYNDLSSISTTESVTGIQGTYNLRGQRMKSAMKGLNIIKLANGKTIKRIIK